MTPQNHPRTVLLRQWFNPSDWEWLKAQAGVTDDRPLLLVPIGSPTLKQAAKLTKPNPFKPEHCQDPAPKLPSLPRSDL